MTDESNIVLEEDSVRLVGSGESPVVDIKGEDNSDLSESDGDVRVGDTENMLKMGVSLDAPDAGNGQLRATSDLRLGSAGESIVKIAGTDESPVVDIKGGDNWDLSETDGDVRIGTEERVIESITGF